MLIMSSQLMILLCCFQSLIYFLFAEFDSGINHFRQEFCSSKFRELRYPSERCLFSLCFALFANTDIYLSTEYFKILEFSSYLVGHFQFQSFSAIRGNFMLKKQIKLPEILSPLQILN